MRQETQKRREEERFFGRGGSKGRPPAPLLGMSPPTIHALKEAGAGCPAELPRALERMGELSPTTPQGPELWATRRAHTCAPPAGPTAPAALAHKLGSQQPRGRAPPWPRSAQRPSRATTTAAAAINTIDRHTLV